jgi:hypothetical protein
MPIRVYSFDSAELQEVKKLMSFDPYLNSSLKSEDIQKLKNDPDANIIFARQDYLIKDGMSMGLDAEKYYLYLKAADEFLDGGEKKLKNLIKSFARVDAETEKKVIQEIEKERDAADSGVGLIFG